MPALTAEGRRRIEAIAARHSVSEEAALTLLHALVDGGGAQAQFNHPELGGMGQWSAGGMIMIGDMFNNALKARIDALAGDLATLLAAASPFEPAPQAASLSGREGIGLFAPGNGFSASNWPEELGRAASTGAQNDLHYAYFPDSRRLAVRKGGHITLYDTGEHAVGGFSQQQGGDQTLTFTSQYGTVRVADLPVVPLAGQGTAERTADEAKAVPPKDEAAPAKTASPGASPPDEIFAKLERLADLHARGILTTEEFAAKKAELLARL